MGERLKIRTARNDDNSIKYELIWKGEKLDDVSFVDIIEMVMQFTSALRWFGVK